MDRVSIMHTCSVHTKLIVGLGIITAFFLIQLIEYSNNFSGSLVFLPSDALDRVATKTILVFSTITIGLILIGSELNSTLNIFDRVSLVSQGVKYNQRLKLVTRLNPKKLFWLVTVSYLLIFLFLSNTLILRTSSVSDMNGIPFPSVYIIGCCGLPGSYPVFILNLLKNVGFIITPVNLVLCFLIPPLVGMNISLIAIMAYCQGKATENNFNRTPKILALIGGSTGVLTSCPLCAGNLLVFILGLATGLTNIPLNFIHNDILQIIFIIISGTSLTYSIFVIKKTLFRRYNKKIKKGQIFS